MPATSTMNEQVIEAGVSGPNGADRLITCRGQALVPMQLGPNQNLTQTWNFFVGPSLPHPQFHRATASAFLAAFSVYVADPTQPQWHYLDFQSVEADWDDESGQTEMRVELSMNTGPGIYFYISKIGYSATVLAESPAS
jgi:hypothetical protein